MSKLAVLIVEGVSDFVVTAGSTLTGYMVAQGQLVMPSNAAIIVAVVTGLVGAFNQIRGRIKELPAQ